MKMKLALSHLFVALTFMLAGWLAHSVATVDYLSPGESIAAAWQTQLEVLTSPQGEARRVDEVERIAKISLSSLSMGLALNYDQLNEQQKRDLTPYMLRTKVLEPSSQNESLAVIRCIEEAGTQDFISEACIREAVKSRG